MYLPVPMINSGVVFLSDLWSGQVKAILNQSENVLPLHTSIQDDADPVLTLIHMVSRYHCRKNLSPEIALHRVRLDIDPDVMFPLKDQRKDLPIGLVPNRSPIVIKWVILIDKGQPLFCRQASTASQTAGFWYAFQVCPVTPGLLNGHGVQFFDIGKRRIPRGGCKNTMQLTCR